MARKRKNKIVPKKPEITELEGYKLGDQVYTKLITGDTIGYGEIKEFHIKCAEGLAFTFWDEINGGYRTSLISLIVEDPSGRDKGKLKRARSRKQ